MATIRLVPSTIYNAAGTSYIQITNESNAYTNTGSTTYATIYNKNSSTSSRYVYIRGFNFDDIPNAATVTSFTIKIKGYETGISTSTSYQPYLANGTSTINGSCSPFTTSTTTRTFSGVTADWETIKNYGDNFGIRLNCRRASRNTAGYIYLYGAEIEVTYTLPVSHNIVITGTNVTPTGTQSVLEGSSLSIRSSDSTKPRVLDNNVDVTSQVVQQTVSSESYSVTNITSTYGFALNNNQYYESNNKGHSSSAAVARIDFHLPVSANIVFSVINYAESTYDYGLLSNIDTTLNTNASADSSNVYWSGKNNNSSSVRTVTYSNVPAGDHYIYAKYFKDNYTDSYNDSFQFKITINLNESFTPGTYWVYTLNNITADHNIVFSSEFLKKIYLKINGTWTQYSKVYKKINGSWVEQDDWSSIFDTDANYVKGN